MLRALILTLTLAPTLVLAQSKTEGIWLGFANNTSPQDQDSALRYIAPGFQRIVIPGNDVTFSGLCRQQGLQCDLVKDWGGNTKSCDEISQSIDGQPVRDGSRIALCMPNGYRHIRFFYDPPSAANQRDWYEQPDGSWVERYLDGTTSNFTVIAQKISLPVLNAAKQSIAVPGRVIEKTDGTLIAFIPDTLSPGMWLEWKAPGSFAGPWNYLAPIYSVDGTTARVQAMNVTPPNAPSTLATAEPLPSKPPTLQACKPAP